MRQAVSQKQSEAKQDEVQHVVKPAALQLPTTEMCIIHMA